MKGILRLVVFVVIGILIGMALRGCGSCAAFDFTSTNNDDFEWGAPGNELTLSLGNIDWSVVAAGSSYARLYTGSGYPSPAQCARLYRDGTNDCLAYFDISSVSSLYSIKFWVAKDNNSGFSFVCGNGTKEIRILFDGNEGFYYLNENSQWSWFADYTYNMWVWVCIEDINWLDGTFVIYLDGGEVVRYCRMAVTTISTDDVRFYNYLGTASIWLDDVFVTEWPEDEGLTLEDVLALNYTTLAAVEALNYTSLAEMESWLAGLNYTTAEAVSEWLQSHNYTTTDDVDAWADLNNVVMGGKGMPLWYLLGLAALAAGAWFSKSMMVNIMVMLMAGAGFPLAEATLEAGSATYWGIVTVLIMAVFYSLIQLFTRADHW